MLDSKPASSQVRKCAHGQVEVLKRLDHENVVKLLEVIDDQSANTYNFVYELMELGAIMTEQEYSMPLPPEHCRVYFR